MKQLLRALEHGDFYGRHNEFSKFKIGIMTLFKVLNDVIRRIVWVCIEMVLPTPGNSHFVCHLSFIFGRRTPKLENSSDGLVLYQVGPYQIFYPHQF